MRKLRVDRGSPARQTSVVNNASTLQELFTRENAAARKEQRSQEQPSDPSSSSFNASPVLLQPNGKPGPNIDFSFFAEVRKKISRRLSRRMSSSAGKDTIKTTKARLQRALSASPPIKATLRVSQKLPSPG